MLTRRAIITTKRAAINMENNGLWWLNPALTADRWRTSMYANEMRVCSSLMKGYADYRQGMTVDASRAEEEIKRAKGWA